MQGTTITQFTYSQLSLPMITVYDHPSDFPNHYVARIWDASIPEATEDFVLYDSLDECRRDVVAAGFLIPIPRDPLDDVSIVVSYIK